MKRTWPIIGVSDVRSSSRWYQSLLGCLNTHPDGSVFDQVVDRDETVLVCFHRWGDHGHPTLLTPDRGAPGNGLLLFFRVDDFADALRRARALVPELSEEPHPNPNTGTLEFSVRDLDGYYVTINALTAT